MNTTETGKRGEQRAERYLIQNGCCILARNYRAGRHEIDLIVRERATDTIVFVEVKTRTSARFGRPMEAVNAKKQRFLRLAAEQWLMENDATELPARFDVIEVFEPNGKISRIIDAF